MANVGIIGGGIAGLTAAYILEQYGVSTHIFEAQSRTGGVIRSEHTDGYLIENGPNALQAKTPLLDRLIRELGLSDEVVKAAPSASKRYIVIGNTPVVVPRSPLEVLGTPLLSPAAKLRLLAEPLIGKSPPGSEESVAHFVQRRLGKEVLDYGINPFVAGIFAGDPESLSVAHAFPRLHQLEQNYGSLIVGQIRSHLARGSNGDDEAKEQTVHGLFSFRDGLQMLPDALAAHITGNIERNTAVTSIAPKGERWTVATSAQDGKHETEVDAVVYAAPLHALRHIEFESRVDYSSVQDVSYPPVTVLATGFRAKDVSHPLDGFGMLVPAVEKHLRILGTLFPSSIFPGRAPSGHHLLTTFIGGARHPELARKSDTDLQRIVCQDLKRLLGLHGDPVFVRSIRWEQAIPQYAIGYGEIKQVIAELEKAHPGLRFAGNYRQGISVGAACASGEAAARNLMQQLEQDGAN